MPAVLFRADCDGMPMDEQLPSLRRLLLRALGVGILFVLVPFGLVWVVPSLHDPAAIHQYVSRFGPLAPLVFVTVQALQVIVAPVPAQVLAVAGGYLFGAWQGALFRLVGVTIGSAVAFALSRRYGRPYVRRLIGPQRLARFDSFVDRSGVTGVFLLFLIPGPWPDDVVCFVAGVSTIPFRTLVVLAVVGRGPSLFVASFLGAELVTNQFLTVAVAGAILLVAWLLAYYYRRRLFRVLERYVAGRRQ